MSSNSPTADPRLGLTLGKYRLLRRLGQGGMGVVYEAEDTELQRRVAVKLVPPEVCSGRDTMARFQQEARAAARLNHPNVVAIYDVGKHDRTAYLVMELVRGRSVQDELQARGALPWREATEIVAEACRGLAAAHAAGLVHRDIKPANLMRPAGGGTKLTDFGLAKMTDSTGPALTGQGAILGTPFFMSPEQCGAAPVEARSDIYSLGATYFALLTGSPPFGGTNPMHVMVAHCSHAVPDPRSLRKGIPEACAAIVRRAMAKELAQRYASAEEMLGALEAARAAAPKTARAATGTLGPVIVIAGILLCAGIGVLIFHGGSDRPVPVANQPPAANVAVAPANAPVAANVPVTPANEPVAAKGPDLLALDPARAALDALNFRGALDLLDALPSADRDGAITEAGKELRAEVVRKASAQAQPDLESARTLADERRFAEAESCLKRVEALRVDALTDKLSAERDHLAAARAHAEREVAEEQVRVEEEKRKARERAAAQERAEAEKRAAAAKITEEREARERADEAWNRLGPTAWGQACGGDWNLARRSCEEVARALPPGTRAENVAALLRVIGLGRAAEQAVQAALTREVGKKIKLKLESGEVMEGVVAAAPAAGHLTLNLAGGKGSTELDLLRLSGQQCLLLAREGLPASADKPAALAIFALAAQCPDDADALFAKADAEKWPARADLAAAAEGWVAPWSRAEIARRKADRPK